MANIYDRHLKRIESIKSNYNLQEIWRCEFSKLLETNDKIKQFYNETDIPGQVNPRDALFGGRTNAIRLYYKINEGEEIRYVDFTSLYPYVQKYFSPIGHPQIIKENFTNIDNYFGLIKCRVLPPRNLYFPTLPFKKEKLIFTLCRQCALKKLIIVIMMKKTGA